MVIIMHPKIPRCYCMLVAILTLCSILRGAPIEFKTEFSHRDIFVGEQVIANFVVYSNQDVVEIEVVKFPEFKGFWTENLILRQGHVNMSFEFKDLALHESAQRKAIIGSYLITPMVGGISHTIVPMKIVIKNNGHETTEEYLESIPTRLVISALPSLPPKWASLQPRGIVGNFRFITESVQYTFQRDEPVHLRFGIQGEGNFQEINSIPIKLPAHAEVISKKTLVQGTGQFITKFFEITLMVHSSQPFQIEPVGLVFYARALKKYSEIQLGPFDFLPVLPKFEKERLAPEERTRLAPFHSLWSQSLPLKMSSWIWPSQFLIALGLLALLLCERFWLSRQARQLTKEFLVNRRYEEALKAWSENRIEEFLSKANELIKDFFPSPSKTATDILLTLHKAKDQNAKDAARLLFDAYHKMLFSKDKVLFADKETLLGALKKVMGKP